MSYFYFPLAYWLTLCLSLAHAEDTATVVGRTTTRRWQQQNSLYETVAQDIRNWQEQKVWEDAQTYMMRTVLVDPEYAKVKDRCRNKRDACTRYAAQNQCEENPHFMRRECAPACRICHELDFDKRCTFDETDSLWQAGDVHALFERITQEEYYRQFTPVVHSRPGGDPDDPRVIDGPWIVTLDTFFSDEECRSLVQAGNAVGFKQSIAEVKIDEDGNRHETFDDIRSSSSAYCFHDCSRDPMVVNVTHRLLNATGTPYSHSTYLHFLRYLGGDAKQEYKLHTDFVAQHRDDPHGVRHLTVLGYLSDVEGGGGTHFPRVGVTVEARKGRIALFPNVRNDAVDEQEYRTQHQGLPVERGTKYAFNMYVHQRDYKEAFANQCIR